MSDPTLKLRDGLIKLVEVLADTHPKSANKKEWEEIRNQTGVWSQLIKDERYQAALDGILFTFSNTKPGNDNQKEWEAIRQVSTGLLENMPDPVEGLKQLATQLSITTPSSQNKKEWEKIRDQSDKILELLK